MKKLIELDVIEQNRKNHYYIYRIKNQIEMYEILIQYENSLADIIVKNLLNWVRYVKPDGVPSSYRKRKKKDVDEIYEALLKVFPHPYYA